MCRVGRPGEMLLLKVMTYMRPKMHALLLDTTINSALTVRLNIFQARCVLCDQGRSERFPSFKSQPISVSVIPGVLWSQPAPPAPLQLQGRSPQPAVLHHTHRCYMQLRTPPSLGKCLLMLPATTHCLLLAAYSGSHMHIYTPFLSCTHAHAHCRPSCWPS